MDAYQNEDQLLRPNTKDQGDSKELIKLVVERTQLGSSHGNKADVKPILKLTKVDHHFVPNRDGSDEDLQIKYRIRGLSKSDVKLRISSASHNPSEVFERPLTKEELQRGNKKIIKWNGETNCASGPLQGKLINPMFGPYKVELIHRRHKPPGLETNVIFRELKLERMPWAEIFTAVTNLPAATFPLHGASTVQKLVWVQYKLNELGYFAGPVQNPPDIHMLHRALFRYTQEHPAFPKFYDFQTIAAGAPGQSIWGWKTLWENHFGPINTFCKSPRSIAAKQLITCLENNERRREEVLENDKALSYITENSCLFVDHNIFSQNKEFGDADAHAAYDTEFCNRPLIPLRAKPSLLSRTDADASLPGISSTEAVGEFDCEWRIFDPPEDISVVPLPTKANVPLFTKARAYLDTLHNKIDGNFGDLFDTQDNCPPEYGGLRPDVPNDSRPFFAPIAPSFPSRIEDGLRFFTKANVDQAVPVGIIGANGAIFQGSYIAGDNYVIQARITFEKHLNGVALQSIHESITGLVPSFAANGIVKQGEPKRFLTAQSGKLTIWRRTAVSRVFDWGHSNYPQIEWNKIADNFRAAFVRLIPPQTPPQGLDLAFDAVAKTDIVDSIIRDGLAGNDAHANRVDYGNRQGQQVFNPESFYPLPLFTLTDYETSQNLANDGSSKKERFNRYTEYLANLVRSYPAFDHMGGAALAIRKGYDRLFSESGLVIVRTSYLPRLDWNALLPPNIADATRAEQLEFKYYRGVSAGFDHGVVILDADQCAKYSDDFFYSHEINHCVFGSHAHQVEDDHDKKDKNCIMYYGIAVGNVGETWGWSLRSNPDLDYQITLSFDGYDGNPTWDGKQFIGTYVPGIKSYGNVSSKFKRNPDALSPKSLKDWIITGSLETVQKAVNEFKFEPDIVFIDKTRVRPPNLFIALKLNALVMSPMTSDGKMPLGVKISDRSGASRPFQNLMLEPFNVKNNEPRFCGKCLLKLRGWKIRSVNHAGLGLPPDPLPLESEYRPVNPRMEFVEYEIQEGKYLSQIGPDQVFVDLKVGATDPQDATLELGPLRFLHVHRLSWESNNGGSLAALKGVKTREWVQYQAPTQGPPFSQAADPDQEFYMGEADASKGEGFDDHSMRCPSLICYPLTAGSLIGYQWYQYKTPNGAWEKIPGAAFELEKTVYQRGAEWILKFKKTNLVAENPVPFLFEVHYLIGQQPLSQTIVAPLHYNPTPVNPHLTNSGGQILSAGTHQIMVVDEGRRKTNLAELERWGYLAPKPW